jgi:hypothetical protein
VRGGNSPRNSPKAGPSSSFDLFYNTPSTSSSSSFYFGPSTSSYQEGASTSSVRTLSPTGQRPTEPPPNQGNPTSQESIFNVLLGETKIHETTVFGVEMNIDRRVLKKHNI